MAAMGCWPLTPLDAHPGSIVLPIPEIKSNNFQEPWRFSPNLSKMTSIITSRGHKLWQWNIVKHTETTSSPETKWGIASGETQHAATATETSGIQVMALAGRRAESCQRPEDVMCYQVLPKVRWNFGKKHLYAIQLPKVMGYDGIIPAKKHRSRNRIPHWISPSKLWRAGRSRPHLQASASGFGRCCRWLTYIDVAIEGSKMMSKSAMN